MIAPFAPLQSSDSPPTDDTLLTNFTANSPDLGWYVVNDNVMGGRSEGDFRKEEGQLHFTGRTNTNGGGFSSIRTKALQLDLSDYTGVRVTVRGDGRRYTWRLATNARWRGREISYWADFDTKADALSTVEIPFSRFVPRFRGTQLDGPALDAGNITGMGLMIYDDQDGPFDLSLANVAAYSEKPPFMLSNYQWKKRVLVLSAPASTDKQLREQQEVVALSREEFSNRDMALVTLLDNSVSTAGNRKLTADEVTTARVASGIVQGSFALRLIGKDGSVKLASDTPTSMAEIYSLIDSMPMRQLEKFDRR